MSSPYASKLRPPKSKIQTVRNFVRILIFYILLLPSIMVICILFSFLLRRRPRFLDGMMSLILTVKRTWWDLRTWLTDSYKPEVFVLWSGGNFLITFNTFCLLIHARNAWLRADHSKSVLETQERVSGRGHQRCRIWWRRGIQQSQGQLASMDRTLLGIHPILYLSFCWPNL